MNFESPVTSDPAVRKAIAMGIDKDSFVSVLLKGYGYPAVGVFPDTFSFGGQNLTTESYDPDGAKKVLEEAGWVDSDGDGIREKASRLEHMPASLKYLFILIFSSIVLLYNFLYILSTVKF